MPERSWQTASGRPRSVTIWASSSRSPRLSACARQTAPAIVPVASSIAASKLNRGPRPSSQSWGEPSTCSSIPSWTRRSRRWRCCGGRRWRGLVSWAARRIRRTVLRERAIPSRSAKRSHKWLSLVPAEVVRLNSTTRSRTAAVTVCPGGRPRLPCGMAAAPSRRYAASRRRTCRSETPSWSAASTPVNAPSSTRFNVIIRTWSWVVNATLLFLG